MYYNNIACNYFHHLNVAVCSPRRISASCSQRRNPNSDERLHWLTLWNIIYMKTVGEERGRLTRSLLTPCRKPSRSRLVRGVHRKADRVQSWRAATGRYRGGPRQSGVITRTCNPFDPPYYDVSRYVNTCGDQAVARETLMIANKFAIQFDVSTRGWGTLVPRYVREKIVWCLQI